ncbi:hypothetical protein CesoFtcFv8_009650 [Champsocephalus esox]|uniref:Uncharacterized protein n=1 Tax=Champsocephalus esox TaxID=159716 RepID=A0AAN8C394_9TELE|nr:hypothetical protein CesoFtcFv8_009650 [Champsocephalus esox]
MDAAEWSGRGCWGRARGGACARAAGGRVEWLGDSGERGVGGGGGDGRARRSVGGGGSDDGVRGEGATVRAAAAGGVGGRGAGGGGGGAGESAGRVVGAGDGWVCRGGRGIAGVAVEGGAYEAGGRVRT